MKSTKVLMRQRKQPSVKQMAIFHQLVLLCLLLSIASLPFVAQETPPDRAASTPAPSEAEDAKPAKAGWLADPITGCGLWDETPKAGRAVHWSGECKDGPATGNGTADWSLDGEPTEKDVVTYAGGKRTGKGATIYPSGNRYEGEFLNDKRNGHGSFTWSDGTHYEGKFIDGKRTGKGVMTWSNGNRYEGEFLKNMWTGMGVNTLRDGSRYEGEFLNNKWNGKGVLIRPDGTREEGNFVNGVRALDKLPPLPRGAGNSIQSALDASVTEFAIKTRSAQEQAAAKAYVSSLSAKTQRLWYELIHQSGKDVNHVHGRVVTQFTILREGTIEDAKIIQSAGNDELDHFALKSILLSDPAPPLPKDIPNDRITVRFSFAYMGS
jgi:TonB family protein